MRIVKLQDFIDAKGSYPLSVSAFNEHGEGPQTNIDVEVISVPFTIDISGIIITDMNGNEIHEVLSCGQKVIAKVVTPDKKLPDTMVVYGTFGVYNYMKNPSDPTQAVIELDGVFNYASQIDFVFQKLLDYKQVTFTIADMYKNTVKTYTLAANTWEDVVGQFDEFYIDDSTSQLYYLAPNKMQYEILKTDWAKKETTQLMGGNHKVENLTYKLSKYWPESYGVVVTTSSGSILHQTADYDGPKLWKDYINKWSTYFTTDEQGYIYFIYGVEKPYLCTYEWRKENRPLTINDYVGYSTSIYIEA